MSSAGTADQFGATQRGVHHHVPVQDVARNKAPRVSVVIPTYNSGAIAVEAVESVLAQTYQDLEIVVVDDGSTDNTEQAIRQFGDRVRYLKQENQGVSAARNTGIKHSRGEYIAFLDSDDLWAPDKLAEEVPWLDADPTLGLVYCDWAVVSGADVLHASYLENLPASSGYVFDGLVQSGFILTSGVVVRRTCLEDVGDFDKALAIAQDYDLWLRISYRWKVQLVTKRLFTKRNLDGSLSSNLAKTAQERITLFQKILRKLPSMPPRSRRLVHRQMALNYWDVGYERFDGLFLRDARRNFFSSLLHEPTNVKSLAYFAATFLPPFLVRTIKARRRVKS